ncbi:MAG: nucleotidyltransferase domain-containing protein [Anaerolineae bacterium]
MRSLSSPTLKWPDAEQVFAAVRAWAASVMAARPDVVDIGIFGAYARGDWGVGSDVDVVIVVDDPAGAYLTRGLAFDTADCRLRATSSSTPPPSGRSAGGRADRFATTLAAETIWWHLVRDAGCEFRRYPHGRVL